MRFLLFVIVPFYSVFSQSDQWTEEYIQEQITYYKDKDLDSLHFYVNELIKRAEKKNNALLMYRSMLHYAEGAVLFNKLSEADSILSEIKNPKKYAIENIDYLLVQGKILNGKGKNDEALEIFYQAIDKNSEEQLNHRIPEIYAEIAAVLRENNDLENCTKYYRFALEKARENNNIPLQVKVCIQLCKVYNGWITVDLDSSVYYGEKAMEIAREAEYEYGYVNAISIVSAPIIRKGEYKRGLEMSKEALKKADHYNLPLLTRFYLTANQAFAFEGLKIYDSALFYMKKGGELRPGSLDYPRLQYRIFKAKKEYKKALEALETYHFAFDSTLRNRNKSKLSSIQARYEADIKEKEVNELTQKAELQSLQLSQQRYLLAGSATLFLFLLGGGFFFYRQRQLKQKQAITNLELEKTQKKLELEKQFRASELKALRSQMNPHFVFNALNSIQDYIMSNERKLAGKYLGKFADLMRIYLEHSQMKVVSLREEIDALKLYLELEKLRFEDSLDYEIHISDQLDEETPLPSLLIQPYVENAIKHGLLHKNGDRKLHISIKEVPTEQILECEIIDNGIGRIKSREINKMRNPDHRSFATHATKSRLELLNHDRSLPIEEKITDLFDEKEISAGTKVTIRIPMAENTLETEINNSETGK